MKTKTRDPAALGAQLMPTRDLLTLAGVHPEEAHDAEHALSLHGTAREVALRPLRSGPRLVAALELGRRAWMLPSPAGRRVRAPADVAAVCAPRFAGSEHEAMSIALDRRMSIARVACGPVEPVCLLRFTLAAGVTRIVVAMNRAGSRAVPTTTDTELAKKLLAACQLVDVILVDIVILGDDGFSSFTRLGLLDGARREPRYR